MLRTQLAECQKEAVSYLIDNLGKAKSHPREKLLDLFEAYGGPIATYPTWHPLGHDNVLGLEGSIRSAGFDHTVFLREAIITCPYQDTGKKLLAFVGDGIDVSIGKDDCVVFAKELDFKLYSTDATPILLTYHVDGKEVNNKCSYWMRVYFDRQVMMRRMVLKEISDYQGAEVAEPWGRMKDYLLGKPNDGSASGHVIEGDGDNIRYLYEAMIRAGVVAESVRVERISEEPMADKYELMNAIKPTVPNKM